MEKLRSLFGFGDSEKPEENEETSEWVRVKND